MLNSVRLSWRFPFTVFDRWLFRKVGCCRMFAVVKCGLLSLREGSHSDKLNGTVAGEMSFAPGDLWLISAPNEGSPQETWDKLNRETGNMSVNHKFNVPDLKVSLVFMTRRLFSTAIIIPLFMHTLKRFLCVLECKNALDFPDRVVTIFHYEVRF